MKKTMFGARIVHGVLIVGMMSTTVTLVLQTAEATSKVGISLGFDKIRFVKPVFIGDTITVNYEVTEIDASSFRSLGRVEARNQNDEVVCAAVHVMKWV